MSRNTSGGKKGGVVSGEQTQIISENKELRDKVKKYERRLEIDYSWRGGEKPTKYKLSEKEKETFPDAVSCRDDTIKLLQNNNDKLSVIATEGYAIICKEMSKFLAWDREVLPDNLKPLYDALDKAGWFDDHLDK